MFANATAPIDDGVRQAVPGKVDREDPEAR
jgi:hypothetical protein